MERGDQYPGAAFPGRLRLNTERLGGPDMPADNRLIQAELAAHRWDNLDQVQAFLGERIARYLDASLPLDQVSLSRLQPGVIQHPG